MIGVIVTLRNGTIIKYETVNRLEYDLNASSQGWTYISGHVKNRGFVFDKLHSAREEDAIQTIEIGKFDISEYD